MRTFTHGHVRQLQAAARDTLIALACRVPLLAGADTLCFVDIDSMLRRVYGKQKQGHRVRPRQGRRLQRLPTRLQPADHHTVHTAVCAGDRRDPATRG
jgi:hypothetical protein